VAIQALDSHVAIGGGPHLIQGVRLILDQKLIALRGSTEQTLRAWTQGLPYSVSDPAVVMVVTLVVMAYILLHCPST
jgi:hypothetical protein